jgi:hypothetical protein
MLWDIGLALTFPFEGQWAFIAVCIFIFGIAKIVKFYEYYTRQPMDLLLFPIELLFGQLHMLLKIYCLFTINETAWGSREGADDDNKERMKRLNLAPSDNEAEQGRLINGRCDFEVEEKCGGRHTPLLRRSDYSTTKLNDLLEN